jgi:hypothetical protein
LNSGRRVRTAAITLSLGLWTGLIIAQSSPSPSPSNIGEQVHVTVGPNILVSRDGNVPHVELHAASNPKNSKNLVGAAITLTSAQGSWATKAYWSEDGGSTWGDVRFAEVHESGAYDPQVAFGIHGTAYFSTLKLAKDEKGNTRASLLFYRSEDAGKTWQKPLDLGYSNDHEMLVVDHSVGRFAGRVYMSTLSSSDYPVYRLRLFRSDDDGRTFVGPVEAANGGGKIGLNTISNIVVVRDGTLVIPYVDFEFDPKRVKESKAINLWSVYSTDGGVTFSQPTKIGAQQYDITSGDGLRFFSVPVAAADLSLTFPDRIYVAWNDLRAGKYRMVMAYSSDRGKTWSKPIEVDGSAPAAVNQSQPAIAVNKYGAVAVTWFDTRNSTEKEWRSDEYVAVSVDGGKSFLPPVRVSSESSNPAGDGNQTLIPSATVIRGRLLLDFTSAYSRWANGGDYMGLTADTNGDFHPFWADSRTGTYQIMTSKVSVRKGGNTASTPTASDAAGESQAPAQKMERDLTDKVELVFGATRYDGGSKTVEVPISIKNKSQETLFGPLKLELVSVGGGFDWEDAEDIKKNAPVTLNAGNQKSDAGALFDFTAAMGTDAVLASGAMTSPMVWKMKVVDPSKLPSLRLKVSGFVVDDKGAQ